MTSVISRTSSPPVPPMTATMLFAIVAEGHELSATVLLRPHDGDVIACELRAERTGQSLEVWLRFAEDVNPAASLDPVPFPVLTTRPAEDVVFAAYAERLLALMPSPLPDGLALRLRRVFPHARVSTTDPTRWVAFRDGRNRDRDDPSWWHDARLPRVRYDDQGSSSMRTDPPSRCSASRSSGATGRSWSRRARRMRCRRCSASSERRARSYPDSGCPRPTGSWWSSTRTPGWMERSSRA